MSSEKKSLRIPNDTYDHLGDLADDLDINESRAAIRAMQRGLVEYGHGTMTNGDIWLKTLFGEAAKALAAIGIGFMLVLSTVPEVSPPTLIWFAAATLGGAILFLLAERSADAIAALLNVPDTPPWKLDRSEGDAE